MKKILLSLLLLASPAQAQVIQTWDPGLTVINEQEEGTTFTYYVSWLGPFDFSQGTAFELETSEVTGYWSMRVDVRTVSQGSRQTSELVYAPGVTRFPFERFQVEGLPRISFDEITRVELQFYNYGYDNEITVTGLQVPMCPWDVDGNGAVGSTDFNLVRQHFGEFCE